MAKSASESRRAPRISLDVPIEIDIIGHREVQLHPNLAAVYERVRPSAEMVGTHIVGVLRDLSTDGAFIAGPALPLLSRVAFSFPLSGCSQVQGIGWILWRRIAECEVPKEGGGSLKLAPGFGVLFETIPLETRKVIASLIAAGK